jgi:hypothetical protein
MRLDKWILIIALAVLAVSVAFATWILVKPQKPIAIISALPDELQRKEGR